ncbi:MAG: tetratricopeptide repeat protein [Bacteroidota bacterium]
MSKYIFISLLVVFSNTVSIARTSSTIDSILAHSKDFATALSQLRNQPPENLLNKLETTDDEYDKVKILNALCWIYFSSDPPKAIEYAKKQLPLAEKLNYQEAIIIGYDNLGYLYKNNGNYERAIDYLLKSLKIKEEIGDQNGIAVSLSGIGSIYYHLNNHEKTLEYWQRSLKIMEELEEFDNVAAALGNIGLVYAKQDDWEKALQHYNMALKINRELGTQFSIAANLNNIGELYYNQGKVDEALKYYLEAIPMFEKEGDKSGLSSVFNNIGEIYADKGDYQKATEYGKKGLAIAKEIDGKDDIKSAYETLAATCSKQGVYKKAYEYYQLYAKMKDTLLNEKSTHQIAEMQTRYETEKKEKENQILRQGNEIKELEIAKQQSDLKRQKIVIFSAIAGLVFLFVLAFLLYNRNRLKQKANELLTAKNEEISRQKEEIEEKNKDITDSIRYASNIQQAILPKDGEMKSVLPEYFVFFQPRDIVSGDFYWFHSSPTPALPPAGGRESPPSKSPLYQTADPALYQMMKEKAAEMRNKPTEGEAILWNYLKDKQTGYKIRRQHIIDRFIVDFACLEKKLAIEVDGDVHDYQKEEEDLRTSILHDRRFKVIRFKNAEVIADPEGVVLQIKSSLDKQIGGHERKVSLPPAGGEGRGGAVYIAACDCTGHGVPGAFVSMIGNDLLNQVIIEKGVEEPGEILTQLNLGMKSVFTRKGYEVQATDGMDMTLISLKFPVSDSGLNNENTKLKFAGAQNHILIVRKNISDSELVTSGKAIAFGEDMAEVRGDRQPIGGRTPLDFHFANHNIELQKNDAIYIFSDGYIDQFGGTKDKKFMIRRFKELLLSIKDKSMEEQSEELMVTINEWMKDTEQIDDILVIGVRV